MVIVKTTHAKPPRWQRRRYSPGARQIDIFLSAFRLVGYLTWDATVARHSHRHRHRRAQWLVGTLLDLGPTFIKIGQALSTRADLLPLEYVQALSQLQDRVPAFPTEEAIAIIESELAAPLTQVYSEFDPVPLAAASLGQVHKARLHTGEEVVVKVQRPGLKQLFDLDFKTLHKLVKVSYWLFPWAQRYNLEAIYQEFAEILYKEIDYVQEAMNADRFRYNFRHQSRIAVPKVYPKYTTPRILTMEYLPGVKISDRKSLEACGIDVKEINTLGVCSYLKQLLQDGFFQADPHPGNMAVTPDGRLIFYDFGMMAEVPSINREQMIQTFFAVLKKDADQVIHTLTDLGLIEPVSDMTPVRRVTRFMLEKFTEKPIELQEFNQVRSEVYALFEQQPFRLPAKMTFILKALTTLDGVARTLDPHYSLLTCAKPFISNLATIRGRGMGALARQAQEFIAYKLNQPSPVERLLQGLEERLEQAELEMRLRAAETDRALQQIHLTLKSLVFASLSGFTLLVGILLLTAGLHLNWAIAAFILSGMGALMVLRYGLDLILRSRLHRLTGR